MSLLEGTSKIATVPSMTPHARRFPSGLKATLSTNFSRLCFSSACRCRPKRPIDQTCTSADSALLDALKLKGESKGQECQRALKSPLFSAPDACSDMHWAWHCPEDWWKQQVMPGAGAH